MFTIHEVNYYNDPLQNFSRYGSSRNYVSYSPTYKYYHVSGEWHKPFTPFTVIIDQSGVIRDVELSFYGRHLKQDIINAVYSEMRTTLMKIDKVVKEDLGLIAYGKVEKRWNFMPNEDYDLLFEDNFAIELVDRAGTYEIGTMDKANIELCEWVEKVINARFIMFCFMAYSDELGVLFQWTEGMDK